MSSSPTHCCRTRCCSAATIRSSPPSVGWPIFRAPASATRCIRKSCSITRGVFYGCAVATPDDNLAEFHARMAVLRASLPAPMRAEPYVADADGACIGNPGPGGWGTFLQADQQWDLWGHLAATTNNRAEALAVLGAIETGPAGGRVTTHAETPLTA